MFKPASKSISGRDGAEVPRAKLESFVPIVNAASP